MLGRGSGRALAIVFGVMAMMNGNSQTASGLEASATNGKYDGRFCSGVGDRDFLRLIDESFTFFNPNPVVSTRTR
jgi:hypothetical protein